MYCMTHAVCIHSLIYIKYFSAYLCTIVVSRCKVNQDKILLVYTNTYQPIPVRGASSKEACNYNFQISPFDAHSA
jgi:hypothetical protein